MKYIYIKPAYGLWVLISRSLDISQNGGSPKTLVQYYNGPISDDLGYLHLRKPSYRKPSCMNIWVCDFCGICEELQFPCFDILFVYCMSGWLHPDCFSPQFYWWGFPFWWFIPKFWLVMCPYVSEAIPSFSHFDSQSILYNRIYT